MKGDWKDEASKCRDIDRAALHDALLALKTCPKCRRDLRPITHGEFKLIDNVWGCVTCDEIYRPSKG